MARHRGKSGGSDPTKHIVFYLFGRDGVVTTGEDIAGYLKKFSGVNSSYSAVSKSIDSLLKNKRVNEVVSGYVESEPSSVWSRKTPVYSYSLSADYMLALRKGNPGILA